MPDTRRERWEDHADGPLVGAAVAFLAAYAWPILQPDLPGWGRTACHVVTVLVWVAFAVDLAVRVSLSDDRLRFLRRNWVDVVTLALPMLRPLRALRVVVALSVLGRRGGAFARGRVVASVVATVAVVGFVAALAVLDAERGRPGANIEGFADASWWAVTTVTTVGYGDRFPVTAAGRAVAVGLMVTGIALVGVVTAALASWFVDRLSEVQAAEDRTGDQMDELAAEVRALRREVQAMREQAARRD
ncbi:potassium channel family protein [Angustibacter aerolatus]